MFIKIRLTKDMTTIIDREDWPIVAPYKWHVHSHRKISKAGVVTDHWYAATNIKQPDGSFRYVELHRLLMGFEDDRNIDHKNGDTLDNRRENLRWATRSQNHANVPKRAHNTSGYKGVTGGPRKWMAQLKHNGRNYHLGYFRDPAEAARAYDAKAIEIHGEFAQLNFPDS